MDAAFWKHRGVCFKPSEVNADEMFFYGSYSCEPVIKECYCDDLCSGLRQQDCCLKCWPPTPVEECDWHHEIEKKFTKCPAHPARPNMT